MLVSTQVKLSDFVPFHQQAAVWISGPQPSLRDLMELAVSEPWAAVLDGDPFSLPADLKFPPGVPRFTVGSINGKWKLEVRSDRLDVYWQRLKDDSDQQQEAVSQTSSALVQKFLTSLPESTAVRLAVLTRRVAEFEQPASVLAKHFCRSEILGGPLNRPESFEIHAHKIYEPDGLPQVNSWVRWRTGLLDDSPAITVENDLNTLKDAASDEGISSDEIRSFLTLAPPEAERILREYLFENQPS